MVFGRVEGGNTTYFFGQVTNQSFRAYFPLVFLDQRAFADSDFASVFARHRIYDAAEKQSAQFPEKNLDAISKIILSGHIAEFSMLSFIALYAYVSITGNLEHRLPPSLPDLAVYVYFDRQRSFCFRQQNRKKLYEIIFGNMFCCSLPGSSLKPLLLIRIISPISMKRSADRKTATNM